MVSSLGKAVRILVTIILAFPTLAAFVSTARAADLGVIEAGTLNSNLSAWVILDARPKADWLKGHIPGAKSFSWEDYTRTDARGVPYKIWPPAELAKALGEMGIDENTPVVIYGDADKSWGGEGWGCWALAWLGHKSPLRLLSGGIQAWRNQNLPLHEGAEKISVRHKRYTPALQPQLDITTPELIRLGSAITLIDTRSTMEWLMGKIPGAIHISWEKFYTGKEHRIISASALKALLQKHGVTLNRPVVYYCTGGIRSGYTWLAHTLAGLPPSKNHEGGYDEWKKLTGK